MGLEVVAQFPRCHDYNVKQFLYLRISDLGVVEGLVDIVHRVLYFIPLDDDDSANRIGCGGNMRK